LAIVLIVLEISTPMSGNVPRARFAVSFEFDDEWMNEDGPLGPHGTIGTTLVEAAWFATVPAATGRTVRKVYTWEDKPTRGSEV